MQYRFADLILDDQSKSLMAGDEQVSITRKSYEVLLYMLNNPERVIGKDELIEHVWHGRVVTDNTVDQCLSKLRKTLQNHGLENAIESVYGHGIKFNLPVRTDAQNPAEQATQLRPKWFVWAWISVGVMLSVLALWLVKREAVEPRSFVPVEANAPRPLLMVLGAAADEGGGDETADWYRNPDQLIEQMFKYTDRVDLRLYAEKPPHLNRQAFVENQWRISPELNTVMARLQRDEETYTLSLTLTDGEQHITEEQFTHENLSEVFRQGSRWLHRMMALEDAPAVERLLPDNAYVTELYMRGLLAMRRGDIDKAAAAFELCIAESPDFHLARLELAHIRNQQGRLEESMALLDTLQSVQLLPAFEIEMAGLKSNALDIQGHAGQANDLLYGTIEKYAATHPSALNDLRLVLSQRLQSNGDLARALEQLQVVQSQLDVERNPRMSATVSIALASVLHEMGQEQAAESAARQALDDYTRLQDLIGVARSNSTLGRILVARGEHRQAADYLERALSLAREMNYPVGIGAAINDLLPLLVTLGLLEEARELNEEMIRIAEDIEFPRMRLVAMQHAHEMNLIQGGETVLMQTVKAHRDLAERINNRRALQLNDIMAVEAELRSQRAPSAEALAALQAVLREAEVENLTARAELAYGRHQLMHGDAQSGVALLQQLQTRVQGARLNDLAIQVAHALAQHWLDVGAAQKALQALHSVQSMGPPDYPHLLLQAQAEYALGDALKAHELAQRARQSANQLWRSSDQAFLNQTSQSYQDSESP